jgi:hypothetical protein
MSKICFTTSLKKDAILLMEESLMAIDTIKKLNKTKSQSAIEKPSLMTRTITDCLKKDFLKKQKHIELMKNLRKRSTMDSANKLFTKSFRKINPFTFSAKLKQPQKLRKQPRHEPVSYCDRLKELQYTYKLEQSGKRLLLKKKTLVEDGINQLNSWNVDIEAKRIIYDAEGKLMKSKYKWEDDITLISDNSDSVFKKIVEELRDFSSLSDESCYIDWDEINQIINNIK